MILRSEAQRIDSPREDGGCFEKSDFVTLLNVVLYPFKNGMTKNSDN